MGVFVKICGLGCREDVEAVASFRPDALGFNFWPGSSRYVRPADVAEWSAELEPDIVKVGIFVDASREELVETAGIVGLDVIQLHGEESPDLCSGLSLKVWKVLHLKEGWERRLESYRVDAFLVDSYSTQSPGGTGKVCDWKLARACVERSSVPVLLAGGLTPANVEEAIREVRPWGVDVCSGVELEPGRKNLTKVEEFIKRCRNH